MIPIDTMPEPPYYAVIFTSTRTSVEAGYTATAQHLLELAKQQPGFLGVDSAHDAELGITVSYWRDLASIKAWRNHTDHLAAQQHGRKRWYQSYTLRIARVESASSFVTEKPTG